MNDDVEEGRRISMESVNYIISLMKELSNLNSAESYPFLKNILHNISMPLPRRKVPKKTLLIRCRPHFNGEGRFNLISDLAHRTDFTKITKFGRANEPGQAAFYCSDDQKLSFIETSVVTRQNNPVPFEDMTASVWSVEEDLVVTNLIANEKSKENKIVSLMHEEFENYINQKVRPENRPMVKSFLTFISEEYVRESKGDTSVYKISCAFSNYVYNVSVTDDGIIYPSSIYPKEGMNFVLWPSSVSKLMFRQAIKFRMEKHKDLLHYDEVQTIESKLNDSATEKVIHW